MSLARPPRRIREGATKLVRLLWNHVTDKRFWPLRRVTAGTSFGLSFRFFCVFLLSHLTNIQCCFAALVMLATVYLNAGITSFIRFVLPVIFLPLRSISLRNHVSGSTESR